MCCLCLLLAILLGPRTFGMVIPSANVVQDQKAAMISLNLSFSHPMDMVGMNLIAPKAFAVVNEGKSEDLKGQLKAAKIIGHEAWSAQYTIKKPGVYQFVMEPTPYWEPAEDCFIIHYTKTYVAAFGEEEGWDEPAGLKPKSCP